MERRSPACIDAQLRTMGRDFLHFSYEALGFSHIMKTFELLTPKYLLPELQLLAIGLKAAWNRFKRAFNARSWWINFI